MASLSTISPARAALHALLTTACAAGSGTALAGVQLSFGHPVYYEEQEVVALLGISDPTEDEQLLGPQSEHDERYQIELVVKAFDPSSDAAAVDARGFAMADGVRAVVNANKTLSGKVLKARVASQRSEGAVPVKDGGWLIFLELSVACFGRATTA